jgi:uncharacterized protein YwlG (UPF0340 family)
MYFCSNKIIKNLLQVITCLILILLDVNGKLLIFKITGALYLLRACCHLFSALVIENQQVHKKLTIKTAVVVISPLPLL